jgi:hypothetical protein
LAGDHFIITSIGEERRYRYGEMAMKCPNCGELDQKQGDSCSKCGKEIMSPGERAQVLATLIQSQDSITWLAFSLAMTLESVLLVGFYELESKIRALGVAGLILAIAFLLLVMRSNHDMKKYYSRAKDSFPYVFHYELEGVWKIVFKLKARHIMAVVLLAWIAGWIWVLL